MKWKWDFYTDGDGAYEHYYSYSDPDCDVHIYDNGVASIFTDTTEDEILLRFSTVDEAMEKVEEAFR